MTRNIDIEYLKRQARICAEAHTIGYYQVRYAGRFEPVIAVRTPNNHLLSFTRLFTHDFEKLADCSAAVARKRLRMLVAVGFLQERPTAGGCTSWYIAHDSERRAIGERIIEKLVARGLQFDKSVV